MTKYILNEHLRIGKVYVYIDLRPEDPAERPARRTPVEPPASQGTHRGIPGALTTTLIRHVRVLARTPVALHLEIML